MGFQNINTEQKIRISLSEKAVAIIQDDMETFQVPRQGSFINTIIRNFHDETRASLKHYLQTEAARITDDMEEADIPAAQKEVLRQHLIQKLEAETKAYLHELSRGKFVSRLYHINNENLEFLSNECVEEEFYNNKPGLYIKCMLEEYANLSFIQRERVFKRPIYTVVEQACKLQNMLQVRTMVDGENRFFHVYPYAILPDTMGTQDYLVCYTKDPGAASNTKRIASFSMARMNMPTVLKQTAFISNSEADQLMKAVQKRSVNYLLSDVEEIHVRFTEKGQALLNHKLIARPEKVSSDTATREYVFRCSQWQAFKYFFPFGKEVEIIKPVELRKQFKEEHQASLLNYE